MIFFISDLHLSPERPEITQAFFDFLEDKRQNATALYILGDFFNAWLGDDDDTAEFIAIKKALAKFSQNVPSYFMHGNRDFLVGETFARETGLTLLQDPTLIQLAGCDTLLLHGDSLCTRDEAYMQFRQMVRQAPWQQAVLAKPLYERKVLAAQLRAQSQSMNSNKAEDIMDVTQEEVEAIMAEYGALRMIHGHTHRPARHVLQIDGQEAERIVLGDWENTGWYLQVDEAQQTLNLQSFKI